MKTVNFRQIFNFYNPSGQTLKQRTSAKCYHRPIFDLYTCQYGPQEDFLQFCFSKITFLIKNDIFLLTKRHSFLGVFLNLPREKTVKYFFYSMIPHDIKPKIYQTKKTRALYHACVLKYAAAKIRSFLKNGLYFGRPLYNMVFFC